MGSRKIKEVARGGLDRGGHFLMEDFYKDEKNWLFPEVQQIGGGALDNMTEAEEFLRGILTADPDKPIVVNFSGGKDSLTCLALTEKVLRSLNDPRRPIVATATTGYDLQEYYPWLDYLKSVMFPRFTWLAVKPTPFVSYAVEILGLGKPPTNMPNMRQCNGRWKQNPLKLSANIINRDFGVDRISICGTRAEESSRRLKRLEKDGRAGKISGVQLIQPLGWITARTLWSWLEDNLEELTGVSYDRLKQYYSDKGRDGCWVCSYHKDWTTLTPFQAWVQQYQKQVWDDARGNPEVFPLAPKEPGKKYAPVWLTPYVSKSCRAPLRYRKQWYADVKAAQERFGEVWIKPVHEDFIKEIWNYQVTYADDHGELAGVKHWNHYREEYLPKMLNPYLYPLAFDQKVAKDGTIYDTLKLGEVDFYNKVG